MLLKGGYETSDPRLDAIPFKDERSRNFPVTAELPTAAKLKTRHWLHGPLTDQGREGACVGHGWTSYFTASPRRVKLAKPTSKTSEYAFNYYRECRQTDEWPGEDYDGTSVLAAAQILQERGFISEFRWAFGLNEVLLAVSRKGPAVLGIPWYSGMYDAPGGVLEVSGKVVGGHCILARGVSLKRQAVLLRNSWGADWGIGGDAWISFANLDRLLRERGEACIPVRTKVKAA